MKLTIKFTPEMLAKLNNGEPVELIPLDAKENEKITIINGMATIKDIELKDNS